MAPPKSVAEVQRAILPRLTWNGSSPRATITPPYTTLSSKKQQKRQSARYLSSTRRQLHTSTLSPSPSLSPTACRQSGAVHPFIKSRTTSPNTLSHRSSAEPRGNPIRYNGVYVAASKPARRAFHATVVRSRDHHFDTLKFVQRLKREGFSEEQAVAMMRVLNDVIQESIQNLTRTMVLKEGRLTQCKPDATEC